MANFKRYLAREKWPLLIAAVTTLVIGRLVWTNGPITNFIWTVAASIAILCDAHWLGSLLAPCAYWGGLVIVFLATWAWMKFKFYGL